ncbi:hypothetical protein AB0A63_22980 [Lentzea sp. NPDC042327]|uniref:hypothetical protein n=1 Tax=Lentzea sp. NPDC042327 TaxID=3154801 RepID=UPI0034003F91
MMRTLARPVVAPEDMAELMTAVAEPEAAVADPPLHVPTAGGALLAGLLLIVSPGNPTEPEKR